MNWKQRLMVVVAVMCLVLVMALGIVVPFVLAQEPEPFISPIGPVGPPMPDVDLGGIEDYVASVGVGAVILIIIEILKRLGAIPDGTAGRWATIANIVAFAGLILAGVFDINYTGDQARAILDLLERVGQAVLMILSSPLLFDVLRRIGVLPPLASRAC